MRTNLCTSSLSCGVFCVALQVSGFDATNISHISRKELFRRIAAAGPSFYCQAQPGQRLEKWPFPRGYDAPAEPAEMFWSEDVTKHDWIHMLSPVCFMDCGRSVTVETLDDHVSDDRFLGQFWGTVPESLNYRGDAVVGFHQRALDIEIMRRLPLHHPLFHSLSESIRQSLETGPDTVDRSAMNQDATGHGATGQGTMDWVHPTPMLQSFRQSLKRALEADNLKQNGARTRGGRGATSQSLVEMAGHSAMDQEPMDQAPVDQEPMDQEPMDQEPTDDAKPGYEDAGDEEITMKAHDLKRLMAETFCEHSRGLHNLMNYTFLRGPKVQVFKRFDGNMDGKIPLGCLKWAFHVATKLDCSRLVLAKNGDVVSAYPSLKRAAGWRAERPSKKVVAFLFAKAILEDHRCASLITPSVAKRRDLGRASPRTKKPLELPCYSEHIHGSLNRRKITFEEWEKEEIETVPDSALWHVSVTYQESIAKVLEEPYVCQDHTVDELVEMALKLSSETSDVVVPVSDNVRETLARVFIDLIGKRECDLPLETRLNTGPGLFPLRLRIPPSFAPSERIAKYRKSKGGARDLCL
ncbi:hypothetical protein GNI_157830 [Gregarina niphandrodes]|uniref:EF-hand domain-containing protein n=1 Tax=Gregarina niphandrodes TaxID=110365 RepID=A0A023AZT5_GRENI|nr:hypothetical protein GNI_157830 [Gregarina niphandrodes]EZG43820.1 hypothetical protein GNI_157830 [Gregarina niphandrodes]|eukprot:XP_011133004.1 hypothetical protein GNI_157830 [Gregarina niphandrodes]